ncbi:MAG: hypothetical protein EON58_18560 [Alphaproteobacteria bacterium]|nr:MAG: hypothetical protein EON58_18560 [Alphaproteobacteria bacterium]
MAEVLSPEQLKALVASAEQSKVEDGEDLWRCFYAALIPEYKRLSRVPTPSFTDPEHRISVDRANIKLDPELVKMAPEDGVLCLPASTARMHRDTHKVEDKPPELPYQAVVVENKLPNNDAHALIYMEPHKCPKAVFRRLQVHLAREAQWLLRFTELEPDASRAS